MLCNISCLSEKEYRVLGIPEMKPAFVEDNYGAEFPSPYMLANSWNKELIGNVAKTVVKDMSASGVTLAVTPGAKVKISPYRTALSEDVCLASELAGEYLEAAKTMGLAAAVKDFSLTADEIEWMDESPKSRVIYEYVVRPYRLAANKRSFEGALVAHDVQTAKYERVNGVLAGIAAEGEGFEKAFPVCPRANMENTVSFIANGVICLEGVGVALEAALNKYRQMKKSVDSELISPLELEDEVAKGHAMSPEMLDEAADRLIDFAFACERKRVLAPDIGAEKQELALRAARESIVLLKNEKKLLPLNKKLKACMLGDIVMSGENEFFAEEFKNQLEAAGYTFLGKERGYDIAAERGEELLEPALELAKTADVVFLFLGFDKARERRIHKVQKLSLPANQQILLERLDNSKSKIVAVVSAEHAADFVLDRKLDAILIAPVNTRASAKAVADVVSGEYSPSGRLANSIYLNTDVKLKKQKVYKARDGIKSGPFIGYRYYDTADYIEGYPFGHGLGYAEFVYSKLTVKNGTVSVTVKNAGKMTAAETVQIYIGIEDSAVIRPKKELMAFAKVELAAGEKKTLSFMLDLPKVFDTESRSFVEEKGKYTVYAATSVTDVKLTCTVEAGEAELKPDGEIKSDYLQSESNIIKDNYKLEADCDIMKKSVFNIVSGIAALLMAVVLKAYCVLSDSNAMFFDVLAAILAVAGWVFFVAEAIYRKKDREQDLENIEEANEEAFAEAESVPLANADSLFVKEFDVNVEDEVATNVVEDYAEGFGAEHLVYVDNELTFGGAVEEFIAAALEKGHSFEEKEARKIFSAMASSRVILTSGLSNSQFEDLMVLLGNYFESGVYIEHVDETYANSESLLFKNDANGNRSKTNVKLAFDAAYNLPQKAHFAGLADVKLSMLSSYISPVVKHAKNPTVHYSFTAHNERNIETSFSIPQNIWFILNIAEGQSLADIPESVAEIASLSTVSFKECAASEYHANIRKFSYYQMEYLCEKYSSKMEVEESVWKKLDKL
ncbi:MAG: glycoside hydrolase family 3 C-terminal domain-containing protein, partial [Clostridia bacterium]|nr:glycoside hydrolase family 3 C-terminal domain-containing protein [Clostridia bacterium]